MRTILCALLVLCGLPAFGQVYRDWTQGTNSVQATATNSTAGTNIASGGYFSLDCVAADEVTIHIMAKTTSATNATVFTTGLQYSFDDTNYYTLAALRVPLTLSYTNTVSVDTNIDCSWFRYLKVGTFENIATAGVLTNAVTNIVVRAFFK